MGWTVYEIVEALTIPAFFVVVIVMSWLERRKIQREKEARQQRIDLDAMRAAAAKVRMVREVIVPPDEPSNYGTAFWADPRRWENTPDGPDGRPEPFWMYQRKRARDYLNLTRDRR